jgi:hypothetical protein
VGFQTLVKSTMGHLPLGLSSPALGRNPGGDQCSQRGLNGYTTPDVLDLLARPVFGDTDVPLSAKQSSAAACYLYLSS